MNIATLKRIVENQIINLEGNAFQELCNRLCIKLYPDDYTPVRAGGPKGDLKNDGYCPKSRVFFAAHATRGKVIARIKRKILSDLKGCLQKHPDVAKWVFLTNTTLVGEVEAFIDSLRPEYAPVVIETWAQTRIAERICEFSERTVSEIIDLALDPTVEITSEIDYAASLLKELKAREAMIVLDRLWPHNDQMTPRQKYRVKANLGHAYSMLGEYAKAADCFMEASAYDPTYEKARARVALAYLMRGNRAKAHAISSEVLKDFPEERVARAVWIRSASEGIAFEELQMAVPENQLEDPDIQMAMAEAAAIRGCHEIAGKYASKVLSQEADEPGVKEAIADIVMQRVALSSVLWEDRSPRKYERDCLEQACVLYSDAITLLQQKRLVSKLAGMHLKRSRAYVALSDRTKAEEDCTIAHQLDPSNPEAVFAVAGIKAERGDIDGAIQLLETLNGRAMRPTFEFCFAQALAQRGLGTDKIQALQMLKSRLPDIKNEPDELRFTYLSLLTRVEAGVHGVAAAVTLAREFNEELVTPEARMCLKGEALHLAGDEKAAVAVSKELLQTLSDHTSVADVRRTALLLQELGFNKDALELWKRLVKPDYIGRDTRNLLKCADKCGDAKFIIDFAKELRTNGFWDRQIFELELFLREKFNDDRGVQDALEEFVRHPSDDSYTPYARTRLSILGIRMNQRHLVEDRPETLPPVTEVPPHIGRLVACVLRHGPNPLNAAQYAYELVRLHWTERDAHMAMLDTFLPLEPEIVLDKPTCVAEGSAVCYREDGSDADRWYVIEDSKVAPPDPSRNEFGADREQSKAMLGKKVGEHFALLGRAMAPHEAVVRQIESKYVYRYNCCLDQFGDWFPEGGIVQRIPIPDKNGKPDFSALRTFAEESAEHTERLAAAYRDNLYPIASLAMIKGRSMLETMNYLATVQGLKLKCCTGTDPELVVASSALEHAKSIVVDCSALVTLLFTNSFRELSRFDGTIVVSEGTLDELRMTESRWLPPKWWAGSFSVNGFVPGNPEVLKRAKERIEELIAFVEDHFVIESGLVVAELPAQKRDTMLEVIAQHTIEATMLGAQAERVLWTDDLAVAEIARAEFGCHRIWTQLLFEHLARRGTVDVTSAMDVTLQLFAMEYYYTRPTLPIMMRAIARTNGEVDDSPLREVLNWFSDNNAKTEGQFQFAAGILRGVWQSDLLEMKAQQITIRLLERLSQRRGGTTIIQAALRNIDRIFGLDVVNGVKARTVIEAWCRGRGRRIIIPS